MKIKEYYELYRRRVTPCPKCNSALHITQPTIHYLSTGQTFIGLSDYYCSVCRKTFNVSNVDDALDEKEKLRQEQISKSMQKWKRQRKKKSQ